MDVASTTGVYVVCRSETCHPETCFRLSWCAILKKFAFLQHVSDWHCANFVISKPQVK